jgi:hypothetical protein
MIEIFLQAIFSVQHSAMTIGQPEYSEGSSLGLVVSQSRYDYESDECGSLGEVLEADEQEAARRTRRSVETCAELLSKTRAILQHISEHPEYRLTVKSVARKFGMTVTHAHGLLDVLEVLEVCLK